MARTIYPVNTMSDGDVVIALSLGNGTADVDALGVAGAEAVSEAIVRAVRMSPTMGGVPGLASLVR
jgi:L-aminopeptidase/D-esterase-like protein